MLLRILFLFSLCFAQSSAKPSSVKPLDDGNFDETERGEWAVDFYAPWCSHCRTLEPVWVKVANELKKKGSKVHMAKLDAVLNPISAKQNGVRGYPTIQFIRDGAIVAEYASASRDADSIMKWISSLETKQQREEEEPSAAASKAATDSSTRSSSSGAADDAAVPSFLSLETIKENIRRAPILACGICAGFGGMVGIFMGVFIGVAYSLHLKKIA